MADGVYEFFWRGFIEAENRGLTYHVILEIDGKHTPMLPPKQADALGWPLSRILADMNGAALIALDDTRTLLEAVQQSLVEEKHKVELLERQTKFGAMAFAVPPVVSETTPGDT
jgi:hypothetical protein